jgi:hypothetical protein
MSKRVQVTISISAVNVENIHDTFDAPLVYGEMSFEAFQAAERAVAGALFDLGDQFAAAKRGD